MDEEYWRAFRTRACRRAGAQMLLILAPLMIVGALAYIVGPMDHPAGDIRDNIVFRLAAAGLFITVALILFFGSVRLLRGGPPEAG